MAIVWGSWVYGSTGSNQFRVGIEFTYSSTAITADYYLASKYEANDSSVKLVRSGASSGSWTFAFTAGSSGATKKVGTVTVASERGVSKTFLATIQGLYNSAAPTVIADAKIPATVPSAPGKPVASSPATSGATSTSAAITLSSTLAAANGSDLIDYDFEVFPTGSTLGKLFTVAAPRPLGVSGQTVSVRATGLIPNRAYTVRSSARNGVGRGPQSAQGTFTTAPSVPSPPTNVNVARSSDTSHTLTWTRAASDYGPYSSLLVQRSLNGGAYATVATLAGTATSYVDTGTKANGRYSWRVQATNASGSSAAVVATGPAPAAGLIETTPNGPTGVTASKGSSGIAVSWTPGAAYPAVHEVWHQAGESLEWVGLATLPAGTSSYVHVSPRLDVTHRYHVRAKATYPTTLFSAFATSNTVQLAAPPAAPTIVNPSAVVVYPGVPGEAAWRHNPVDSSEQRLANVRVRRQGDTSWVETGALSWDQGWITYYGMVGLIPGGVSGGDVVEWQVRTWGEYADPSPWSATATFTLSSQPAATIDDSHGTIPSPRHVVEWSYFQAEGNPQAAWEVELRDGSGNVVEARAGSGTAGSVALAAQLPDGVVWTALVRVRSSLGLWSEWASDTLEVSYVAPAKALVGARWNADAGAVSLDVENEDSGALPEAVSNDLWRSIDDGPWVRIVTGVSPWGAAIDPTPSLSGVNRYRAVAWTEDGVSSTSEPVEVEVREPGWTYVNFGPGFTQWVRFYGKPSYSGETARSRTLHRFAGRDRPVAFFAPDASQKIGVSGRLTPDSSTLTEWERAVATAEVVCYRDPKGRRMFGVLGPLSHSWERNPRLVSISFDVEEVDHDE